MSEQTGDIQKEISRAHRAIGELHEVTSQLNGQEAADRLAWQKAAALSLIKRNGGDGIGAFVAELHRELVAKAKEAERRGIDLVV